jgi:glycosyltransferase involved in cell wall biosynthesis
MFSNHLNIAVIIPCYNEASTIRQVISDFKKALPTASVYVYDNNSTDQTAQMALMAGAIVRRETRQGKGYAITRALSDIEADIYIMVDGDATYDSNSVTKMIQTLCDGPYDMVNAARQSQSSSAYRIGHSFGNHLFSFIVEKIFGKSLTDLLSGYRAFSRRFVKSFPCFSKGFEIETELTIHALSLQMPVVEISTPYYSRPEGSFSKLSTFKDGFRILRTIFNLMRREKPLLFFTSIGGLFLSLSLLIGAPVIMSFLKTGLVFRLPSAILAASLAVLAFLSLASGLILDTVTVARREIKRLRYLSIPVSTNTRLNQDVLKTSYAEL